MRQRKYRPIYMTMPNWEEEAKKMRPTVVPIFDNEEDEKEMWDAIKEVEARIPELEKEMKTNLSDLNQFKKTLIAIRRVPKGVEPSDEEARIYRWRSIHWNY